MFKKKVYGESPKPNKPRMLKSEIKTTLFDFLHQGYHWLKRTYLCREEQARIVVERSLIDSSPRERAYTFFVSSVAVYCSRRLLCRGSSILISWLVSSWLLAVCKTQEYVETKVFLEIICEQRTGRQSCSGFYKLFWTTADALETLQINGCRLLWTILGWYYLQILTFLWTDLDLKEEKWVSYNPRWIGSMEAVCTELNFPQPNYEVGITQHA
jgi:hypothetical protein